MSDLPYRAITKKIQFPIVTLLIVLVCILVYLAQYANRAKFEIALKNFCIQEVNVRQISFQGKNLDQKQVTCRSVFKKIYLSEDKDIAINTILSHVNNRRLNPTALYRGTQYLKTKYAELSKSAPAQDLGMRLGLVAGSFDPVRMLTAAFAHGSWWHVLVNVLAFVVFASAAERLLGWGVFSLLFLFLVYSSHSLYSLMSLLKSTQVQEITIGLSGVVFGMMVFMAVILRRAKVRFEFWFFVKLFALSLSIQLFVLFSISLDFLHYFLGDEQSRISFRVHWAGMIVGGLAAFFIPLRLIRRSTIHSTLYGLKGTYPIIKYKGSR